MTSTPLITRMFAEADVRKAIEANGPLDLVVDPGNEAEAQAQADRWKLASLLKVTGLDLEARHLPAALAGTERPLWIFSPAKEEALLALLESLGRPAQGFYRDIYGPANAGWDLRAPPVAAGDLNAYAIVCTARSGSTYLCELLTANRGGKPKEHLRPPVIDMLAKAPQDAVKPRQTSFIQAVLRHGQRDGVFGTKLIAHFCKSAKTFVDHVALAEQIRSLGSLRILYLIRRDKVLQAISTERAQQTNIYHIRTEAVATNSARAEYVYDYDSLRARVDILHREEEEVQRALATMPHPVLVVDYDALVADPERQMRRILDFLGIVRPQIVTNTRVIKILGDEAAATADRFCHDHEDRTGTPVRRYFTSPLA